MLNARRGNVDKSSKIANVRQYDPSKVTPEGEIKPPAKFWQDWSTGLGGEEAGIEIDGIAVQFATQKGVHCYAICNLSSNFSN